MESTSEEKPKPKRKEKVMSIGVHISPRIAEKQIMPVEICCILHDKETWEKTILREKGEVHSDFYHRRHFSDQDKSSGIITLLRMFIIEWIEKFTARNEDYKLVALTIVHKQFPCEIAFLRQELVDDVLEMAPGAKQLAYEESLLYELLYEDERHCHAVVRFSDYMYFYSEHEFLGQQHKAAGNTTDTYSDITDEATRVSTFLHNKALKDKKLTELVVLLVGESTDQQKKDLKKACAAMAEATEKCCTFELKMLMGSDVHTSYCAALYGFKKTKHRSYSPVTWYL